MPHMSTTNVIIKKATEQDFDGIWEIFHAVVVTADTYAYSPETTKEEAYPIWMPPHNETYVAFMDDKMVGTYLIRANQPGLGSHVANAAYMVHPRFRGHGIGFVMAAHSIEEAKKLDFKAMQFNLVVSTNKPAIHLWKKAGFKIIGTTPNGFNHPTQGLVDAHIMHRHL